MEAELRHGLRKALAGQLDNIRKGAGRPTELLELTHLAALDWLEKAIYASAPAEFLTQFDYRELKAHAHGFLMAKREAAIAHGLDALDGVLLKGADTDGLIANAAGDLAGIWAGLLENAPLIAAWDLLYKADPGVGHMVMQPPRHINCRCILRVRKVLLVDASPAPRTQAEQPTVDEQERNRTDETTQGLNPPMTEAEQADQEQTGNEDDTRDWQHAQQHQDEQPQDRQSAAYREPPAEEGDPDQEGLYFAAPARLRKAGDGSAWVAFWHAAMDERTCRKNFTVPWGGVVTGCAGLNGLVITSGPLLGHSIETVNTP